MKLWHVVAAGVVVVILMEVRYRRPVDGLITFICPHEFCNFGIACNSMNVTESVVKSHLQDFHGS